MPAARKKKIADRNEILEFLTGVMRDDGQNDKERLAAAYKLAKYLGLEAREDSGECQPRVIIYDGKDSDSG